MKPDGVEQWKTTLLLCHKEGDLRTSEYESLGPPPPETIHDPQEDLFGFFLGDTHRQL